MNSSEKDKPCPSCELEQNLHFLRQTYFFSGIPVEILKVFAYLCLREEFQANEYVFRQGEDDGQAYYIIEGRAILEFGDSGRISPLREYRSGDFVGGLGLLGKLSRRYSLKTETRMVCLVLSREKFSKVWRQFPEMTPRLFQAVLNAVDTWENQFLSVCAGQGPGCRERLGLSVL
jgi:CRP/FNR family transcriptional regulator, cyclic AMP receptor protein